MTRAECCGCVAGYPLDPDGRNHLIITRNLVGSWDYEPVACTRARYVLSNANGAIADAPIRVGDTMPPLVGRETALVATPTDPTSELLEALASCVTYIRKQGGHMWPEDQQAMRGWIALLAEHGR